MEPPPWPPGPPEFAQPQPFPPEPPPEPPPPAEVRRMLADNMRDMGRVLMISGMKAPRQQMMAIGATMDGLMAQLDALADQPGRKALQRRLLLNLRPKVMSGGR